MISGTLYGAVIFITFLAIFWAVTRYSEEKTFLRIVMFSSLCYGILVVVLVRAIFRDILEDPVYFPDAYSYLNYAAAKVAEWHGEGTLGYIPLATRGYTYFVAIIFLLFGPNIYAVIFAQLILASLVPVLTFSIARQLLNEKTAKCAAFLVAFYPDLYVWASFALKEVLATFLICLAMDQFLKFRPSSNKKSLLTILGSVVFLLFVRPYIALFLGLIFLFTSMWPFSIKKLIWLPIAVGVFIIFMRRSGLPDFLTIVSEYPLPVYSRGEILATGALPELLRGLISGQLLPYLVMGIGRYLFSPLPWQATNAYQAVVPGTILWYFLFPALILGAIKAIKMRQLFIPIIVILFLTFWYSLIATGTDPRWRFMSVPFACIFSAYGFRWLLKSLSGVMIWICGIFIIWFSLSAYTLGIRFLLRVFVPVLFVGILGILTVFRQRAGEGKKNERVPGHYHSNRSFQ
jgi:hypothetical protein